MAEDILNKICTQTRIDLNDRINKVPLTHIRNQAEKASPARGFINALRKKHAHNSSALIAEIKKASPSKGLIRSDFSPKDIAQSYESAGAACLSVLTDAPFFQGRNDYLIEARDACALPVLRKDFMIDSYQVYEACALGADCILLIVAALDDDVMKDLYDLSHALNMDVLVEVHNQDELDRALKLNANMIGVNNRNLKTLEVDIQTSHELAKNIPDSVLKVAESGIYSHDDLQALQQSGFQTFLVGESLMRQDNVEKATRTLLGTNK